MTALTNHEADLRRRAPLVAAVLGLLLALGGFAVTPAGATEATGESDSTADGSDSTADGSDSTAEGSENTADEAQTALLQEGAEVYSQICSSCHQPGGAGLDGQFPPLIDNPHVDDAAYVADVITNGRRGEIEVAGVTYDGVMPSFSTLSDAETAAVIAYIQNDFQAPVDEAALAEPTGPVAGTELPALANMGSFVAFLLAASVIGLVLLPRLVSVNDRLATPWLDAWLKTTAIVAAVVFFTVYVPDWALKRDEVAGLDRFAQDLIGVLLWGGGLVVVIGGLWYAHREDRI